MFRIFVFAFIIFLLFGCSQEQPEGPIVENQFEGQYWTAEQMTNYYKTVYEWPEDKADFVPQFYDHRHISQITTEELALLKAGGGSQENTIQSSSYYFYVTDYDDKDEEDFEDCESTYGSMFRYDSGDDEWKMDTDYMTNTTTVTNAYNYADNYCHFSDFSGLVTSSSSLDDCMNSVYQYFPILTKPGKEAFGNVIMAPTSGLVKTDLNPDFEDWTSGNPDAWLMPYDATYSIPTDWVKAFVSGNVIEYTGLYYDGSTSCRLILDDSPKRNLASYYYEIPSDYRWDGKWIAEIRTYGTDGSTTCGFGFALYDASDNLISGTGDVYQFVNMDFAWVNQACTLDVTTAPKYVRFVVQQEIGQANRSIYIDDLRLSWEGNDVSLPVEYNQDLDGEMTGYPTEDCDMTWSTSSETNSHRWALFSDCDHPYEMVSDYESAMGTKATTTNYSRTFTLDEWFFDTIKYEDPQYVYLGCQDISGEWEYFEEDQILLEY